MDLPVLSLSITCRAELPLKSGGGRAQKSQIRSHGKVSCLPPFFIAFAKVDVFELHLAPSWRQTKEPSTNSLRNIALRVTHFHISCRILNLRSNIARLPWSTGCHGWWWSWLQMMGRGTILIRNKEHFDTRDCWFEFYNRRQWATTFSGLVLKPLRISTTWRGIYPLDRLFLDLALLIPRSLAQGRRSSQHLSPKACNFEVRLPAWSTKIYIATKDYELGETVLRRPAKTTHETNTASNPVRE